MRIADFGLSRSPEADMMTTQLGTIVIIYLFSIGWLLNCSKVSNIPSKLMYIHMEYCFGRF
jgi:hypothetical protein